MEAKKKQCIPVSLKNVSIHLICVDNLDSVGFFSKLEKVGTMKRTIVLWRSKSPKCQYQLFLTMLTKRCVMIRKILYQKKIGETWMGGLWG